MAGDEVRTSHKEEHRLSDIGSTTVVAHGSLGGETCGLGAIGAGRRIVQINPARRYQLTLTSGAKALAMACVSICSAAFDAQ